MTALPIEAVEPAPRPKRLALVASKGTLDQAYPPLILATTAASLGWEVGIYFTFYGLDILHQERLEKLKMASLASPFGSIQVPNLLGALPGAQGLDVTFFACATTMGVMGVEEGDLISGCEIAGAAAFLDFAAEAEVQLFV